MEKFYTNEINIQMLIQLMKANGIKKVVASPGATNVTLVGSLQQDPYFEMYSSVDERSAAYIACGLAAESGESVALTCTGATASRNYVPGLTEAYYRHLPVLAITSAQHPGHISNYFPQMLDRTSPMNDLVNLSVDVYSPSTEEDKWACNLAINKAMIALKKNGGGPVHINLMTNYSPDFSVRELPQTRVIRHYSYNDAFPEIPKGSVAIFVGIHEKWSDKLIELVESFCAKYNAVVICDQTSNYNGKYSVKPSLLLSQRQYTTPLRNIDLLIHIGYVSGAYLNIQPKNVWRVNPDGEVRDTFKVLKAVFALEEVDFFGHYANAENKQNGNDSYLNKWKYEINHLDSNIPELPFSNPWIARQLSQNMPANSSVYLGILNTLRAWNLFPVKSENTFYSNTGGFGIDGLVSSALGVALASGNICYAIVGDLAFFYDMNSIGNRHVPNNLRVMVINNGRGTEFRNFFHPGARFGDDADKYIAAAGHYGKQSPELLKHYSEDLGFEYFSASNKEEFKENIDKFTDVNISGRPILFEVFTDTKDESNALEILFNMEVSAQGATKQLVKNVLGEKGIATVKKIIGK